MLLLPLSDSESFFLQTLRNQSCQEAHIFKHSSCIIWTPTLFFSNYMLSLYMYYLEVILMYAFLFGWSPR